MIVFQSWIVVVTDICDDPGMDLVMKGYLKAQKFLCEGFPSVRDSIGKCFCYRDRKCDVNDHEERR